MESFEETGLSPELVEALAAEGIEIPTNLQSDAIPLLRRGGSVVLCAGPGGGSFAAYGSALLDRVEAGGNHPRALVLSTTRDRSRALALALARLGEATGHRIGALGVPWAFPERADILFSTLDDLEVGVRSSGTKIDQAIALVLDGASGFLEEGSERIVRLLQGVEREGFQFVLVTDEVTPSVRGFVEQHAKRAVFLPTDAGAREDDSASVERGVLRICTAGGDRDDVLPGLLLEIFEGGSAHALLFTQSEDRAADVGDYLALHGFASGAPGDPDVPVWLGVDALKVRSILREGDVASSFTVLSVDPPLDVDELDRRHGGTAAGGLILAYPRELPHLHRIAREGGYSIDRVTASKGSAPDEASRFLAEIERTIAEEDLLPQLILLEPLFERAGTAEVAAALGHLLRKKVRSGEILSGNQEVRSEAVSRPPSWTRLFLSMGEKDGITPRDLLGAILGESGIAGDQVGRIDLRETFSKVEVQEPVAEKVIRALNGTTIRGRSVRADFDRGEAGRSSGPQGGSRSSGAPGAGERRPGAGRGKDGPPSQKRAKPADEARGKDFGSPRSDSEAPRGGGGRDAAGDRRPSAGRDRSGPPFGDRRPSGGRDRSGPPYGDRKPSAGSRSGPPSGDRRPSAGRDRSGPPSGDRRPSAGRDRSGPPSGDLRPSAGRDRSGPPSGDRRPSAGRDRSGPPYGDRKPSAGSRSGPPSGDRRPSGGKGKSGPPSGKGKPGFGGAGKPRRSDSPKPRRP